MRKIFGINPVDEMINDVNTLIIFINYNMAKSGEFASKLLRLKKDQLVSAQVFMFSRKILLNILKIT